MNPLLENIFSTKEFVNSYNQTIAVHSETSKEQCEFLQLLIRQNNFQRSLEIGFAFGISTLAILEEIIKNGGSHLVIDKFQIDHWEGNGLDLVKQAGYLQHLEFKGEFCYKVLPILLDEGRKFDFVYIDSTKQFDWLLVDFFYIDKILEINGIVVFDDVKFSGIRKLLRYICQFPNYQVHTQFPKNNKHSKLRTIAGLLKYLPYSNKYLKDDIINPDFKMGINAEMVALIKTGEDTRYWNWHKAF